MRGDANQKPAWAPLTLKRGLVAYADQPGLPPRPYLVTELKSKCWGFEKCFGLSHLIDILDKNGQFLDPNGTRGCHKRLVTLGDQAPLNRARQQFGLIWAKDGSNGAVDRGTD